MIGVASPRDVALVVVDYIANFDIKMVLVNGDSAVNVLTWELFLCLKISLENLKIITTHLQGFEGMTVPKEIIELSVMLGTYPTSVVILMRFLVLKTPRHTMRLNIGGVVPLS